MSAPNTARVCVVVPFRNAVPWVAEAVHSLRAQTFERWRAVLVDDGSVDGGADLVRAASDARIEVVQAPVSGLIGALNFGIDRARASGAPYIARFDADDVCHPDRFAEQAGFLDRTPEVGVVDSRWEPLGEAIPGGVWRYRDWHDRIESHEDVLREVLVESPICHPAVMLRAAVLPAGPLYVDDGLPEDYAAWLRLLRAGLRFHKLPRRLVQWRDHPERATRRHPRYRKQAFFAAKWAHVEQTVDAERVVVWGARKGGRPWIRAFADAGRLVGVVDIDPSAVGSTRRGVPVVAPADLASLAPDLVVCAVGAAGARAIIEAQLAPLGIPYIPVAGLAG